MKTISIIKVLTLIGFLLFSNYTLNSQVVVERSKDKVVISGIPYFIHLVKKGETAYSISRAYGITVEELTKENPPAVFGVNAGQSLRIPVKSVAEVTPAESVPETKQRDESKFIYHKLKPGETVYFLSKSYGVSENEIVQSNLGIDINKLSVGSEIAVPRREFMREVQKFNEPDKKYIFHKVIKGESLSSIAEKYGLTVRELRKENKDLRFPQVGDFVKIPGVETAESENAEPAKKDSVPIVAVPPVITITKSLGYTMVKDLKGTLNVAVLLPFYLKENSERTEIDSSKTVQGKRVIKISKRPEEWIYKGSLDFLEMYEGILIAADTLRSMGLNININPYDIDSDSVEMTKLIASGKLAGMNLIIGPVYQNNLSLVASYAKELGIPVVSPVPLITNSVLVNNTTLFMPNSSLEVSQKILAKKISEYYDNNIVFIHSDTTGTDEDVNRFKNLIFKELSDKLPYEEIKFREFLFYSRSMFDNDSINRLSHALSEQSHNIVIIASEEAPVISETIMDIHGLSKKFDIKVFGYPAMRDIENLDPKYFFDLDMMIYSPSWIDYTKKNVIQFNSVFRQKFLTEPTERSFAWQGFDIAYYFMSGISMCGKNFIANPKIHNPELLQTEFDFVRKDSSSGFENQKLFIINYTKDYDVKLIRDSITMPR
jgi:LysM repeat protein